MLAMGLLLGSGARAETDSLLDKLMTAIDRTPQYDADKLQRIALLKTAVGGSLKEQFTTFERLYEEYRIFQYDSAYAYGGKLQRIAYGLGDRELITKARLQVCFILLSSGLYRETFDSLRSIDIAGEPDSLKAVFYTLMGRYYYDVANYDNDGGTIPSHMTGRGEPIWIRPWVSMTKGRLNIPTIRGFGTSKGTTSTRRNAFSKAF
jgi:hypothetical protein